VVGQKRLSTWAGLWHQAGMAKTKKNAAAVAMGRVGGRCCKLKWDGGKGLASRYLL
jgi:hypothetical protein